MKQILFCLMLSASVFATTQAQQKGFVIKGCLPGMKDGVNVALVSDENRDKGVIAETTAKNGCFELRGKVEHPELCTLTTNNLALRDMQTVKDSIHWTYTSVFVDNVEMTVQAPNYADVPLDKPISDKFQVTGGSVQNDFNAYNRALYALGNNRNSEEATDSLKWSFITAHPQSVVSVYFANQLLQRGYNLTPAQIDLLDKTIAPVPADTVRFNEFRRNMQYARLTAIGAPLVDLELADENGKIAHLKDIVPKGKFVLIDFWASWCGICIASMPEIQELQKKYSPQLAVIGVSCDQKTEAWKNAMAKHPEPWPQYILTKKGYQDFFYKYHMDNGVPYYTLIAPDGKVMKAPNFPSEIDKILQFYNK